MTAKYSLVVPVAFLAAVPVRKTKTWLLVGGIFAVVGAWFFRELSP